MTNGVLLGTGTYLDKIVANTLIEVAARKGQTPSLAELFELPRCPAPDKFDAALWWGDEVRLIAEVKHASPSKGILIDPFDPVELAKSYEANGAAAISVLTDSAFFQGSLADLKAVSDAVRVPVLRKDFVIDPYQIDEAYEYGADCVLLIVGILDDRYLAELFAYTVETGLQALIEVHDEAELERALKLNPPMIGINNRDLRTFKVDLVTTERIAPHVPKKSRVISESGIFTADDLARVVRAGAHAALVGESIITAVDRAAKLRELTSVRFSTARGTTATP